MKEDYGNDFVTIIDDEGNEFELELLDTIDYNGESYAAFLPTDMDEDDPDYGLILLNIVTDENGNYTGEQEVIYTEPIKAWGNISAAKGDSYAAGFGTMIDYDKVLCTETTDLDENAVVWLDTEPTAPYNYRVRRVSKSINGTLVALKQVDVGA